MHLHMLMFHIKLYLEGITNVEICIDRYNSLNISPIHVHKDKNAHKNALLTLGDEIVSHIYDRPIPVVNYSSEAALQTVAAEH